MLKKTSIKDLQKFVKKQKSGKNKHRQKYFLKLVEEVGELSEMIKDQKHVDRNSKDANVIKNTLEEELADVLFYLLALSNAFDVDLEKAFIEKQKYKLNQSESVE